MTGTPIELIRFLSEQDQEKMFDCEPHKEKRSLDSNSYFHVLCDKLRQKLGISMAHCKNNLITSYGQVDYDDQGRQVVLKANIPVEAMQEQEFLHCLPVKAESDDVIFYRVYRGSHTYNSAEMAKLIDGTIEECKEQGIETATPDQLARMAALWEKKHEKRTTNG